MSPVSEGWWNASLTWLIVAGLYYRLDYGWTIAFPLLFSGLTMWRAHRLSGEDGPPPP